MRQYMYILGRMRKKKDRGEWREGEWRVEETGQKRGELGTLEYYIREKQSCYT